MRSIPSLLADIKATQDELCGSLDGDAQSTQLESIICLNNRIVKLLNRFGFDSDAMDLNVPLTISKIMNSVQMETDSGVHGSFSCDCGCGARLNCVSAGAGTSNLPSFSPPEEPRVSSDVPIPPFNQSGVAAPVRANSGSFPRSGVAPSQALYQAGTNQPVHPLNYSAHAGVNTETSMIYPGTGGGIPSPSQQNTFPLQHPPGYLPPYPPPSPPKSGMVTWQEQSQPQLGSYLLDPGANNNTAKSSLVPSPWIGGFQPAVGLPQRDKRNRSLNKHQGPSNKRGRRGQ